MCRWGTYAVASVLVPSDLSSSGKFKKKHAKIDRCIVGIVDALNREALRSDLGLLTVTSCCGHGETGVIELADGTTLTIQRKRKC